MAARRNKDKMVKHCLKYYVWNFHSVVVLILEAENFRALKMSVSGA